MGVTGHPLVGVICPNISEGYCSPFECNDTACHLSKRGLCSLIPGKVECQQKWPDCRVAGWRLGSKGSFCAWVSMDGKGPKAETARTRFEQSNKMTSIHRTVRPALQEGFHPYIPAPQGSMEYMVFSSLCCPNTANRVHAPVPLGVVSQ